MYLAWERTKHEKVGMDAKAAEKLGLNKMGKSRRFMGA
jgi:hypothetical protein